MTEVRMEPGLFQGNFLADAIKGRRPVIITDSHVKELYGTALQHQLNCPLLSFPAGEQSKTREHKAKLEDQMIDLGLGRDTLVIALGGGVVTDLAGFVAATYCRGVPWIAIPTTLLGMVDASIGGKVGVNTPKAKNIIGALHLPRYVLIDVDVLQKLPEHEIRSGTAEIIKYALIASPSLFEKLKKGVSKWRARDGDFLNELISQSIAIKQDVTKKDPEEQGLRRILNFGHTVGHAIETLSNYSISHGDAIAIGMVAEALISSKLGLLSAQEASEIEKLFQEYGFPLTKKYDLQKMQQVMQRDKKAKGGRARFVLLNHIGEPASFDGAYCSEVDDSILEDL